MQLELPIENGSNTVAGSNKEKFSEINSKKDAEQVESKQLELSSLKPNADLRNQAADPVGVISNSTDSPIESVGLNIPNGLFKVSGKKEKLIYDNNEIPSLELSLKRMREIRDTGISLNDRNVLRHSDQHSAFSRYKEILNSNNIYLHPIEPPNLTVEFSYLCRYCSALTANQAPTGKVGSCSPLDNSSEAAKTESLQNFQPNPNSTPPSQRSRSSSNNSDMVLTTNSAFTKPTVFNDKPEPKSTAKCLHPSAALQPGQQTIKGKAYSALGNTILSQVRGTNQQVQVQHHHHHYYHHHHHVHNMPQQQLARNDDLLLKNMKATASQYGSSNALSTSIESNAGNNSLNGSTSGSNHGSNGQNGSTTALNVGGANIESDNGVAMKGGPSGTIVYGSSSGVDRTRFAQREAALNKFRQKRKERCFEKKVTRILILRLGTMK